MAWRRSVEDGVLLGDCMEEVGGGRRAQGRQGTRAPGRRWMAWRRSVEDGVLLGDCMEEVGGGRRAQGRQGTSMRRRKDGGG
uniref:Uncharacterized protein n=1 Tax=Oryza meridionalis TaxID=40149 RepID=A0A0E0DCB6_9ORYZ